MSRRRPTVSQLDLFGSVQVVQGPAPSAPVAPPAPIALEAPPAPEAPSDLTPPGACTDPPAASPPPSWAPAEAPQAHVGRSAGWRGAVAAVTKAYTVAAECAGWNRAWSLVLEVWNRTLGRLSPDWEANEAAYLRAVQQLDAPAIAACQAGLEALVQHFYVAGEFADVLGPVHMEVLSRSRQSGTGQFFTPWDLCVVMARMNGVPEQPMRADGSPWTFYDPAVGAGATLLAAKAVFAERHGRLAAACQVYAGQDIDADCVAMARIQLRLTDPVAVGWILRTAHLPPDVARRVVALAAHFEDLGCPPVPAAPDDEAGAGAPRSEGSLTPPGGYRATGDARAS